MRGLLAVLALIAACAAIGCGGDDEEAESPAGGAQRSVEEAAVREALDAYGEAVVANDPEASCSAMTESAQEEAAHTVPGASTCESAYRTALNTIGAENREKLAGQLSDASFEVKVSGETAELTAPGKPGTKPLKMRKVGGDWKIDQNTLFFNRTEE